MLLVKEKKVPTMLASTDENQDDLQHPKTFLYSMGISQSDLVTCTCTVRTVSQAYTHLWFENRYHRIKMGALQYIYVVGHSRWFAPTWFRMHNWSEIERHVWKLEFSDSRLHLTDGERAMRKHCPVLPISKTAKRLQSLQTSSVVCF